MNQDRKDFQTALFLDRMNNPVIQFLPFLGGILACYFFWDVFIESPYFFILPALTTLNFGISLYKRLFRKKGEVGKRWDEFWIKYDLNNKNDEYIDAKIREVGSINSNFPDDDKEFARALLDLKNRLKEE